MSYARRKRHSLGAVSAVSFIIALVFMVHAASAQYFGRNKVQYENFKFKVLKTEDFNVYYYAVEKKAVDDAARMAERWKSRFEPLFKQELGKDQPLIFYSNQPDFQQTNAISGVISQAVGGVTEGYLNRVVIPMTGNYAENDHVIGHELTHAFQYEVLKSKGRGIFSQQQMPLWFIEGMAEYLSLGHNNGLTAMWMRDAVLHDNLPGINDIGRQSTYSPYRYGHAVWAYIGGKWGDDHIRNLFLAVMRTNWDQAFKEVLGISADSLSTEWQAATKDKFQPLIEDKTKPKEVGRVVLRSDDDEPGLSLSPAVSPDGKYVAVISRQGLFTLDLYLVDAQSGKILKKLVSSNSDAHFDALRFTNSAGAWSPDSKQFAFVVEEKGDNAIAVVDIPSGEIRRTIRLDSVTALQHLAWSPDGEKLAISGTRGGISDLYLYHFDDGTVDRLTDDRYADLQPSWSPDGSKLVFASDRGPETNFEELTYSPLRIAVMDMATGDIDMISISPRARHISPHYSGDGRYIYVISDPDGFCNIYRYSLADGTFSKITDVATGICGLTLNSPALSVAAGTNEAYFSVFDKSGYFIAAVDLTETEPAYHAASDEPQATILPVYNPDEYVQEYLEEPQKGLVSADNFKTEKYSPRLKLLQIGQPTIGIAVDRFGPAFGGSADFVFSDMLGNRMLNAGILMNGGLKDIGGQVLYANLRRRLNWGVVAGHIPYLTAGLLTGVDTVDVNGQPREALVQELVQERLYIDMLSGLTEYPLSENRRLELTAGYSRYSYDIESDRIAVVGGTVVSETTQGLPSPSALNLFQSSLAYVGDYSFFGFTSPIDGRRYRFEVEPTLGTLDFVTVLADYRQYFMASPFTFAFRAIHLGRYWKDAEDDRLSSLYLGDETLVRGYSLGSFDLSECSDVTETGRCPEIDRLIGSRIGVVNMELRVPLFGTTDFGLLNFPYLPTELALFADGGLAWNKGSTVKFDFKERSPDRIPVFSAGMAARINLFGYIVMQFYYAFPFQRPEKTGQFGFVIAPGW
jgi:hypothetical protein